jgi:Predicted ATPase
VARLDDRFGLLTAGDRSAAPRQRTLRAAIEWSYELLTGPERALFRRLAIFTGWSLEMAEQVCADEADPGRGGARPDRRAGGQVAGRARSRAARPGPVPDAGHDQGVRGAAAGSGRRAATFRGRFRDYAIGPSEHNLALGMARIEASWPDRVDVFRRYDVDAGNVIQILNWCLEQGDAEAGLRICAAVSPCWIVWGNVRRGRRMAALVPGPGHDRGSGPDPGRSYRGARAAHLVQRPGHRLGAGHRRAEAVPRGRRPYWIAVGLNLLAEIALHTRRIDEAAASADEALAIAQAAGDGWNEGYALGTRAAIAARAASSVRPSSWPPPRCGDAADRPAVGRRPRPARPG